ncbi:MAG TPA: hypothetical protein VNT77_09885, partial [Allosphingosinicella sp.]|nr:hypothetical protein [Allosphingosinicella sp.]
MNPNRPWAFEVEAVAEGEGTRFAVTRIANGETRHYRLTGGEQHDYTAFYRELARDYGTRASHKFEEAVPTAEDEPHWRPLITENLGPRILAGYGDPAVLKTEEGYFL